jgi:hypothetical protein
MNRIALLVLAGCEPAPPTPSDQIVVPYQFNLEFSLEHEPDADYTARARLYDIAQAYDVLGNAGTIELTGGDAVFADGTELDIETRTTFLGTLRVDYSQTVPFGKGAYPFELRRPDDEQIAAEIPIPDPFDVVGLGDVAWDEPGRDLTWTPVIPGATIDIAIRALDEGCLTVLGGEEWGHVILNLQDTGAYRLETDVYHSTERDCPFELRMTRRYVHGVPGTWHVEGTDLPANDVWAIGLRTVYSPFVALRR